MEEDIELYKAVWGPVAPAALPTSGVELIASEPCRCEWSFWEEISDCHEAMGTSGVILVVDCDVLWVPTQDKPSAFLFSIPSMATFRADASTALKQINEYVASQRCLQRFLGSKESITMDQWRDEEHSKP
ncbi:hypothetical protein PDIDSM_8563 [Penicillium digitatum]|nr:hypothetical protein PDIDSM_8563 [Penicillium digitatum]